MFIFIAPTRILRHTLIYPNTPCSLNSHSFFPILSGNLLDPCSEFFLIIFFLDPEQPCTAWCVVQQLYIFITFPSFFCLILIGIFFDPFSEFFWILFLQFFLFFHPACICAFSLACWTPNSLARPGGLCNSCTLS